MKHAPGPTFFAHLLVAAKAKNSTTPPSRSVLNDGCIAAHPQPFQGEPRGESPPARCPKPTRRNAGLANGPPAPADKSGIQHHS